MGRRVLVLGGSYFVGFGIVKKLLSTGFEVTLVNRGTKVHELAVKELHCDRKDGIALKNILANENFDYVVDVSGLNLEDVQNSYEAVKHMDLKNYVFISSSAVYCPSEIQPMAESFPIGKNLFWGQYGIDKIEAEDFLKEKFRKYKFNFVVLRPPYLYGEGNYVYREAYIFDRLKSKRPVIIPKGNSLIQFCHVEDLANIVVEMLDNEKSFGKTYNVGDSYGISFKAWVGKCMEAYGEKTEIIEFDNKIQKFDSRDFFPYYEYQYILDTREIEKIYINKIELVEGLKKALEWYNNNEHKVFKKPQLLINEDKILNILNK